MTQTKAATGNTPPASAKPGATPRTIATLALLHVATPIWIGYGAVTKAVEFNPLLLPPPILKALQWFASSTSVDATAFLSGSLRAIIGAEIFLALAILLSRRWARALAMTTLGFFCLILLVAMVQAGLKEGLAEALSGSCGCFGEKGLPASVMFLVDGFLLVSAALAPRRAAGSFAPVATAAAIGVAAAFLTPEPEIAAPIGDGGSQAAPPGATNPTDGASPATPPSATGTAIRGPWPGPPDKYEKIYFPKWAEWVGKPLREQKLALAIEGPMPADFERGDWLVTFSRADCDHCQAMYRTHFAKRRPERVLKVSVPDARGTPLGMPCEGCEERMLFRVRAGQHGKSPEYVFQTPVIVRMKDGVVTGVCTDVDRPDELAKVFPAEAPGTAAVGASGTPAATTDAAWPGPPARLEPFYVAEFEGAVGKPFADVKIARLIENRLPADFLTGRWIVVFFREDCDHCFELLSTHFTGPLKVRTLTVAIPDADPGAILGNPCEGCTKLSLYKGPNYVIGTPVVVSLRDGIVECVVEDVDDMQALEACLKLDAP